MTEKERIRYDNELKVYRDLTNTLDFAEQQGREKGLEEGRIEGREEGLKEGRMEGEIMAKKSMAKSMKNSGMSVADIIRFTGLSERVISEL